MNISVIIPCYNSESYIAETIDSVLNQTVKAEEIIVIDDGSSDKSVEILKSYGNKIILISQENKGVSKSLNFGIKQSKGDYVSFLDSDDLWALDKIENQINDVNKNPEYSIYAGAVKQFVSPEIKNHCYVFKEYPNTFFSKITLLVKRDFFLNGGWFKENGSILDFFEWLDVVNSKKEKIFYSKKILAFRRIRQNSLSQSNEYYPSLLKYLKKRINTNKLNE